MEKNLISVIIPVLNEEKTVVRILDELIHYQKVMEIIVVDGGSKDQTREVVSSYAFVRLLTSAAGRSLQMNLGAYIAKGDLLWFIHADSRFEEGVLKQLVPMLQKVDCSGSCYLKFDKRGFWYSVYSRFSKINWSAFTYGDQCIFVKKTIFQEIGAYNDIPIMEDIDLVRRVKKKCRFQKLNIPVITSARRFEENGVLLQEFKNIFLVILYLVGFSPFYLKRFYQYHNQ